ncbi:hypothetical protein FE391_10125 [Nonomuraea sp. KC401]|uniref:hypothetical protein n=1 Tax=unclassified Nonomuraea TaxID=2593643 RepID=UPI0010FD7CDE|nr:MULTISPECIES: hypothetical protein [unclassified Nonomuraea]NBE93018.1 hypothetical protein [Nonomuraea sp. K271]TLF78162.1 hypothetical protein FE391_10125 [Nonomuraea sp. KC401]
MKPLGVLLSLAVTAVGALWWTTPASYPFGARDRVTVSLSHLFEHDVGGAMTVAAGLAGLAVALLSARPGKLVRAGAIVQLVFFGIVMSDAGVMSVLGYVVGLSLPVAVVAAVVVLMVRACVRGRLWGYVALAALAVACAAVVVLLGGALWAYAGNVTAGLRSYAGRMAWTLADLAAFAAWAWITFRLFGGALPRWAGPEQARRWGRVATVGAALCPLPYACYRLTWLTPWPTDVAGRIDLPLRLQGLMLAFAAVTACVLTLGLIGRWGEVFPRWIPMLRGRPVPVPLPVAVGGTVAGACCLASPGLTVNAVERGEPWALLLWPYPLWGALLGAAVLAYWLRRRDGGYTPASTGA